MNSKHILGLIACAFLLIGCVGSLQTKSPANIGFMPVVGHDTRAEESIPFPQNRSFKLWAQEETSGSLYISNETISYNDGWFAPKPWGIEPLRFHAVWPTDLDFSYSNENGLLIDSYDCSEGDIDILYATTTADDSSESLVTLNFEHLLSRVEFRMIHSLQESMSVMIHKITLSGVAQEGSFGAVNAGEWGALEKYDSYINMFGFFGIDNPIYVYTSLINFEITADKTLWGVEAGHNLVDKFYVARSHIDILFSYPDCEYMGLLTEMEEPWYEVLKKSMLPASITLKPIKPFDEIHDKVTFTFAGNFVGYDKDVFGHGPIEFCYE